MIRNRRSRRRQREPADLSITAFMNLMVILVPFLLITAVFTRMAVLEISVPSASEQPQEQDDQLHLEVVVHDNALVVGDSRRIIAVVERTDSGAYNYERLSAIMQRIKKANPEARRARVLLEADTKYEVLVHVMDTVRMAERPDPDNPGETIQVTLFPKIALGDAPETDGKFAAETAG